MGLDRLLNILQPPRHPVEAGSTTAWSDIERRLGFALPDDYKRYINTFGTGVVGGLFVPFTPFSDKQSINLFTASEEVLSWYRMSRSISPDVYEGYSIYPEASGLFPWGTTLDGDFCFWRQQGPPSTWTVVLDIGHDREEFFVGVTDFLADWLSGDTQLATLPPEYPLADAHGQYFGSYTYP